MRPLLVCFERNVAACDRLKMASDISTELPAVLCNAVK